MLKKILLVFIFLIFLCFTVTINLNINVKAEEVNLSSSWLLTTNYWTKTKYGDKYIWSLINNSVCSGLCAGATFNDTNCGARPVITTPKTNLLAE